MPREIRWGHEGKYEQIKLEDKAKSAVYKLPADAKGWYEFSAGGARALVFVRSQEDLSVSLTPGEQGYRPGQMATLQVQTNIAGQGAKAAVGLFGVDNSLSQIATLRGPDDLGSIRPEITMREKAFGTLDAQALSLGRIRGASAAEATILRVESVPAPAAVDRVIFESAQTEFIPITVLTDNFYIALAELHVQTRAWEAAAPAGETITPKQMAKLWKATLKACKAKGQPILRWPTAGRCDCTGCRRTCCLWWIRRRWLPTRPVCLRTWKIGSSGSQRSSHESNNYICHPAFVAVAVRERVQEQVGGKRRRGKRTACRLSRHPTRQKSRKRPTWPRVRLWLPRRPRNPHPLSLRAPSDRSRSGD